MHGHHHGHGGKAYYSQWIGSPNDFLSTNDNWVVLCTSRQGKNRYVNGVKKDDNVVANGDNTNIYINTATTEISDYGVAFIVSWNRDLTHTELLKVSSVLMDGTTTNSFVKKNIYYEMRRIQNGPTASEYLQCSLDYCNKYIALRMNLCGNRLCRTRLESVACHNHWVNIGSKENPSRQPNVYDCQQSTGEKIKRSSSSG